MRGHHAFLSSLTPFQRQIWPRCRARPRARGMELSTVPHGCTRTCWGDARLRGQRQGPWRSHPTSSVRCPSVRHRSQHEGAPGKQVPLEAWPGQPAPGPGRPPWHFPCSHPSAPPALLRPARGAKPSRAGTTRGKGSPHLPQPHLPGLHLASLGYLRTFSLLEKLQECSFLLDFPHPSKQAIFTRSLGFLGNEQPPAESPTPPVLCYCSCQVLNVAVVVLVTTTAHFAFN